MVKRSFNLILLSVVLLIAIIASTLFTVYESDRAIIVRLGDVLKNKDGQVLVLEPGLHWKLPFIDRLRLFDARLNMTELPPERIVTKEKEVLMVDVFVQWRINNYALFYNTTQGVVEGMGAKDRAEQLLRQTVKGILHAEFGQRDLQTVISADRKDLMGKLVQRANENMQSYGMQVVDIRINRFDYPPEVHDKVYARMSSERKQVAVYFRASGESKATKIRSEADMKSRVMIAEAEKDAESIKGEGDAKAAQIYTDSFGKAQDFFDFFRSLEAYKGAFQNKEDVLILKPDGEFFKFFKNRPNSSSASTSSSTNVSPSSNTSANQ